MTGINDIGSTKLLGGKPLMGIKSDNPSHPSFIELGESPEEIARDVDFEDPLGQPKTPKVPVSDIEPMGIAEWKKWRQSKSPDDLAATLSSIDPLIEEVSSANPGLSRSLLRGQAKARAVEALETYDPDRGASLTTHVRNHLKPLTLRSHNMTRAIPKGRFVDDTSREYYNAYNDFTETNNREPSASEMATRLGISLERSSELMRRIGGFEIPESSMQGAVVKDDGSSRRQELWLEYIHHDLPPRDQQIMDYRLGRNGQEPHGIEETAEKLGVSTTTVHNVMTRVSTRLKEALDSKPRESLFAPGEDYGEDEDEDW